MKIANYSIKGITCNSKEVKKGFCFVAIKGNRRDGNFFIDEAIRKGARVIVLEDKTKEINTVKKVKFLKVKDCRLFLARACSRFYGFPSNKLKICGITGTNGKTTISYLIEAIAGHCGFSCAVIGTINYRYQNKTICAKNTTPDSCRLQSFFAQVVRNSIRYCALEVSSHALDQQRVAGINFNSAIFTNLTQDHLDYHKTWENYFQAKARLFRNLTKGSFAIVNNDDKYGRRLKRICKAKLTTYGITNKSQVMAKDIRFSPNSTEFKLVTAKINMPVKINLVGTHNIYNILAAASWGLSQNFKAEKIKEALEKFKNVPGRLEKINLNQGKRVFIDYAHTPDALFNVLSSLRRVIDGRLFLIFGCGGERDKLKRPKMGNIASRIADYTIITSDNPRSEDPLEIIKQIKKGIKKDNFCTEPSRARAIQKGISMLKENDCLLIAGKGHEDYQILKNQTLHFSDREEVGKCLASMK